MKTKELIYDKGPLKNIINSFNMGVHSVLIADIDNVFITSENFNHIIIKPIELQMDSKYLTSAVAYLNSRKIKVDAIETTLFDYVVYVLGDAENGNPNDVISLSLTDLILHEPENKEDDPFNDEKVWQISEVVDESYVPNIVDEVVNFDMDVDQKVSHIDEE